MSALNMSSEQLLLDNQICFSLYSTNLALSKIYRNVLKKLEITYPQYLVMMILWERDQQTVSAIGERLFLDSATLTPLLKRMEAAELVSRQRSARDERQVIVSLTSKGKNLQKAAEVIPEQVLCAAACEPEALMSLKKQLDQLRDTFFKNA